MARLMSEDQPFNTIAGSLNCHLWCHATSLEKDVRGQLRILASENNVAYPEDRYFAFFKDLWFSKVWFLDFLYT
jgi:hypothetical protein